MKTKNKLKFPDYINSHTNQKKLRKYIASEEKLSKIDKMDILPFLILGKPNDISNKNISWPQAKRRNPILNPYNDFDNDGVINLLDFRPLNKRVKEGLRGLNFK